MTTFQDLQVIATQHLAKRDLYAEAQAYKEEAKSRCWVASCNIKESLEYCRYDKTKLKMLIEERRVTLFHGAARFLSRASGIILLCPDCKGHIETMLEE